MTKLIKVLGVGALTTAMGTQIAVAQDDMFRRDRIKGAGERYLPEFEQRDIRLGGFKLRSELGVGVESNSNIFAAGREGRVNDGGFTFFVDNEEESDIIVMIVPKLNLTSDWNRHLLSASAEVNHSEFTDNGDESHTDFGGSLRGRIDVSREFNFTLNAGYQDITERRGIFSINQDLASEPAKYNVFSTGAEANWKRDSLRFTAGVNVRDFSYDNITFTDPSLNNGIANDRSFRDFTYTELSARAGYAVSPDVSFFVNSAFQQRDYDTVQIGGLVRDASGYRLQVGSNFQLSQLLRGEVAVGYLQEERDAAGFGDISGLAVNADVQWLPTTLTTVSVGVDSYTTDTGQPNLPSALVTRGEIGVVHELKRNILLNASATSGVEEFEGTGIGYNQGFYDYRAGATYKMNQNAHVDFTLSFNGRDSDSDLLGRNFDQTVVGVGVKLFP
ncbi:outer membrane beta-barrel protein [Hirschia maritima]|uniref:outer membrane beta-barrel protein n=1 Tax=Hirschia maritima TaxID=1121961 RepID=UPI000361989A|nr:outer membrane beta-barrel protein [Hirschia maritima]